MTKMPLDKDEGERSSAPSPLPPIADTEKAAAKIAGTGLLLILAAFAAFVALLFFLVGRL